MSRGAVSKSRPLEPTEALADIFERLESAFDAIHPGPMTDDEMHGVAQNVWFAMHDCKRGLGDLYWPGPEPEPDTRPCPACGRPLKEDETDWSIFPGPMGGYVCPAGYVSSDGSIQ